MQRMLWMTLRVLPVWMCMLLFECVCFLPSGKQGRKRKLRDGDHKPSSPLGRSVGSLAFLFLPFLTPILTSSLHYSWCLVATTLLAHPKRDQSWVFIGRTDVEAETPILWPPDAKSWLIGKDPDAGKDWRQEEKETTKDEMVRWHHWLNGHGFG